VDVPELVVGAIVGAAIGTTLGAVLRPATARLERAARTMWRDTPLLVHVERDPAIIWAGAPDWIPFAVYFRNILATPAPPCGRIEWLNWARMNGGVDAVVTQLSITLQAKVDVAVVVEGLQVRNRSRPVLDGVVVTRPTGGADLTPRHFRVDLDWGPEPLVTYEEVGGDPSEVPCMKIAAGDVERFQIWAEARQGWHEWTVELLLLVEGRRVVYRIDDYGSPFTTVGPEDLTQLIATAGTGWDTPQG